MARRYSSQVEVFILALLDTDLECKVVDRCVNRIWCWSWSHDPTVGVVLSQLDNMWNLVSYV